MKHRTWVRLLCLAIGLLSCLSFLAACSGTTKPGSETTAAATQDPSSGEESTTGEDESLYDENGYMKDSIESTLGGRDIHLLIDTSSNAKIWPTEAPDEKADALGYQAYYRGVALEERMDCTVKVSTAPGEWGKIADYITAAEKAGENGYDLMCSFSLTPAPMASQGLLANMMNLQYPELEKPWWPESLQDLVYDGSLYFVYNNSSARVIGAMEAVLANRTMIASYGLDSLEDIVIKGDWTLDVMQTYAANVTENLDGGSQIYGLFVDDNSRMDLLLYGAGNYTTAKNDEGKIIYTYFDNAEVEKVSNLVDKLIAIFGNTGAVGGDGSRAILTEGRAMFYVIDGLMTFTNKLDTDTTYMPLPAPKYDTNQTRYYGVPNNSYDVWSIPAAASNKEQSGLFLEALSSSDYRTIAPYFYENRLKFRYSSSGKGMQIFDLIRGAVYADFGRLCSKAIGVPESPYRNCFPNSKTPYNNYVTAIAEKKSKFETNLALLLENLSKYKNQ